MSGKPDPTPAGQNEEDLPPGAVQIKKRSRVPGVMLTQFVEKVPKDCTTPDFVRKPFAVTIAEGKSGLFKAVVSGDPVPNVTWSRNKGDTNDPEKYKARYDERNAEYVFEIPKISSDQADTYRFFATNTYGRAVCTATLNVIAVGFKKKPPVSAPRNEPEDFRKLLKKTVIVKRKPKKVRKEGDIDPAFWEVLLSAPKKDYERVCFEFGVTDFRWMLKKLSLMKKEREKEQAKVVEKVERVKQIEVKTSGKAEFEVDMQLKDPNSEVLLFKDGVRIDYGTDGDKKHNLEQVGSKYLFSIKDLGPDDAGLYQVDVEDANVLSSNFKVPDVAFASAIKDCKAKEGENATFECGLSAPVDKVMWYGNDVAMEDEAKYEITVSEDKLIHKAVIKDLDMADQGTIIAIAGIVPCKASLVVIEDPNRRRGKGSGDDDEAARLAAERARLQKEKDDLEAKRRAQAERDAAEGGDGSGLGDGSGGDGSGQDGSGGDGSGDGKNKHNRNGPLVPDTIIDPGFHFASGLTDTSANKGNKAELSCVLSSESCEGVWYKDGKRLTSTEGITIIKDGANHKLIIHSCSEEDAGKYRFEAGGRKSEAMLIIQDPPKIDLDSLKEFQKPVIIRAGENASFKLKFMGMEPMKVQWFKEGEELLPGLNVRTDSSTTGSSLLLTKCQRKDMGEVKIKIKNEHGTIEATTKLIVLDKPTPPQPPVDVVESSLGAIEFKWRPPKDDGGCPVTNYVLERQQVGRNTWTKIGEIPGQPSYRDTDIDHGRKYTYRIKAKNVEGISDMMETDDIAAGVLALPGAPAPPKIVSAFKDCINLTWPPPAITGGVSIIGYNLEKRKRGSNLWTMVNRPDEPIKEKKCAVTDLIEGAEYEFRVSAINMSGTGDPSIPSELVFARDPKKRPGKVIDLKLTGSSYSSLSLSWTKPKAVTGVEDEAKGYFVEIRPIESLEWSRCNVTAAIQTSFNVIGLKSMAMYWVRVIATNDGGEGEPQGFDNYIIAMPPPVKPRLTDKNLKTLMVVRAGNTVRVNINFEASPMPDITWLKDGAPLGHHVTVTNSHKGSQLLIPTSERTDTGIYTIVIKNIIGQETLNLEIRVTDDPKPPGPVELEQNVQDTVTLSWVPSPDEKRDDRLHYLVMKRDSVKRTWRTVGDHLFNNKFTEGNILPGREYNFRVFAKNDMGMSEPVMAPTWGTAVKKEKFTLNFPESKALDLECPPKFLVPLKLHTAPQGYECYMSCAVSGNPRPHVTWYRNNVSLNTDINYYISNTCGVCSMLILRVGPKDTGEYKVVADSPLGVAECTTQLTVRGVEDVSL